jgi:hypothetical protein
MREQMTLELEVDADLQARIAAELLDPAFDFRTTPGVAAALGIPEAAVARVLAAAPELVRYIPVTKAGHQLFVARARRRTWREVLISVQVYMAGSSYREVEA